MTAGTNPTQRSGAVPVLTQRKLAQQEALRGEEPVDDHQAPRGQRERVLGVLLGDDFKQVYDDGLCFQLRDSHICAPRAQPNARSLTGGDGRAAHR